jgi:hypothetical protein
MLLQQLPTWMGSLGDLVLAAPDPGNGVAPPGADKIVTILQWGKWLFTAAAVAGGLVIAGKMVISHRRGDDTNVAHLGMWLAACVLAGVAPHVVDALI